MLAQIVQALTPVTASVPDLGALHPSEALNGAASNAKDCASDAAYRKAYDDLERVRPHRRVDRGAHRANLSQAQLAERMNTTQTAIARLESGNTMPSTRTLRKIAKATGHTLRIIFEPGGSAA